MMPFGEQIVILHYSGMLIYDNLYGEKDLARRHVKTVMSVTVRVLQRRILHVSIDLNGCGWRRHNACIVLPSSVHGTFLVIVDIWKVVGLCGFCKNRMENSLVLDLCKCRGQGIIRT